MIHFQNPFFFFITLLIPILYLWHSLLKKRGKRFIFYPSKIFFDTSLYSGKTLLIKISYYLKFLVLLLVIIALTRPQLLNQFSIEKKRGIDILITLDISGSMASVDFQSDAKSKSLNRLEVAKNVISNFIQERKTDRLGLVIFAGTSYTKCPLTIDYGILKYFLANTDIGELEDGTALGMALATSVNRIKNSKSRTRIIILLTDGVNNRGEIDPRDAAEIAEDFNIKVYTIGVGKRGKAPFPVIDSFGNKKFMMVDVQIDEDLLKEIANRTGGLYFRATDKKSLQQIFTEINRWEKTEISTRVYYKRKDLYLIFLLLALFILLVLESLKRTFLRTLP